jgi:hypothetical protein
MHAVPGPDASISKHPTIVVCLEETKVETVQDGDVQQYQHSTGVTLEVRQLRLKSGISDG